MAEKYVEFEIVDDLFKGATEVSRGHFGPYAVKDNRVRVPLDGIDVFNEPGSGLKLVRNEAFRSAMKDVAADLEDVPFPHAPAELDETRGVIVNRADKDGQ